MTQFICFFYVFQKGLPGSTNGGPSGPGAPPPPRAPLRPRSKRLGFATQYQNHFHQSWIEVRENKCQFCLGCCSIFIVVVVVALAMSTLSYSSIIFLGLAESQSGEMDLMLQPTNTGLGRPSSTSVSDTLTSFFGGGWGDRVRWQ